MDSMLPMQQWSSLGPLGLVRVAGAEIQMIKGTMLSTRTREMGLITGRVDQSGHDLAAAGQPYFMAPPYAERVVLISPTHDGALVPLADGSDDPVSATMLAEVFGVPVNVVSVPTAMYGWLEHRPPDHTTDIVPGNLVYLPRLGVLEVITYPGATRLFAHVAFSDGRVEAIDLGETRRFGNVPTTVVAGLLSRVLQTMAPLTDGVLVTFTHPFTDQRCVTVAKALTAMMSSSFSVPVGYTTDPLAAFDGAWQRTLCEFGVLDGDD
jgi:hypothetical protein